MSDTFRIILGSVSFVVMVACIWMTAAGVGRRR